jgi:hypothetical protein
MLLARQHHRLVDVVKQMVEAGSSVIKQDKSTPLHDSEDKS